MRTAFLDSRLRDRYEDWTAPPPRSGTTQIQHPQVGALELNYEKLPIPDADRQTLCIYHAVPASSSAQALILLATATATERYERDAARSAATG